MIASLSLILLCQLAGEVIVHGLGLPVPGPVLGLVFLLLLFLIPVARLMLLSVEGGTFAHYERALTEGLYVRVLLGTLEIGRLPFRGGRAAVEGVIALAFDEEHPRPANLERFRAAQSAAVALPDDVAVVHG